MDDLTRAQYLIYCHDLSNLTSRLEAILKDMEAEDEATQLAAYIDAEHVKDEIRALERQIEQFEFDADPTNSSFY